MNPVYNTFFSTSDPGQDFKAEALAKLTQGKAAGGVSSAPNSGARLIDPSPYQPRTRFREEALDELARSIQSSGIIQPLVVRPLGKQIGRAHV